MEKVRQFFKKNGKKERMRRIARVLHPVVGFALALFFGRGRQIF